MTPIYSTGTDVSVLKRNLRGENDSETNFSLPAVENVHNAIFLISVAFLITGFVLVLYTCWRTYYHQKNESSTENKPGRTSFTTSIFGIFPFATRVLGIDVAEKEETMHLLNNATIYEEKPFDGEIHENPLLHATRKSAKSPVGSKKPKSKYFRGSSIRDGNDTMLMLAFTSVMSIGIFLNLHTTYGSRTVCITMVGDEVRWQAVKQNSSKVKRYKLNLLDVMSVEIGKQDGHIKAINPSIDEVSIQAAEEYDAEFDNLCFSLVTQKTSLYLEAASKLDRDSLIRGFQLRLESLRS